MDWPFRVYPVGGAAVSGKAEIASEKGNPNVWVVSNVYIWTGNKYRCADYEERHAVKMNLYRFASQEIGSAFRKSLIEVVQ